jgi:phospholipid transport system transporter-binding protein
MDLPAKATLETVPGLLDTLKAALATGSGPVRIDASALQAFDTSAIAMLLHAQRLAAQAGRTIELIGTPEKLKLLAELYGVEELLPQAGPVRPERRPP